MRLKIACMLLLISMGSQAFTQTLEKTSSTLGSGNLYWDLLIFAFIGTILVLLLVSVTLLKTFQKLSKELLNPSPYIKPEEKLLEYEEWMNLNKSKPSRWNKLLGLRPIAEEKDIMLEHEFDGIAELDNPTPAWFMWLFYSTIVIAIAYMLTYHVFDWGKLQDEEYTVEVEEAELAKKAYLAKSANIIDENTVKESSDAAVLSTGLIIYNANCVACHGDKGQGAVGPNLTDAYWLHGGKINDIFKTIKYGVPEKGMIAWGKSLNPKQISEVSNFIKSLKGTNPAGAKEAQGNKE
ncbi:MAG: c-type cytochrome [Pyrinomonadaceae bacterium]|nr:c-type cytochrome [Sphingobacteriaceae bacterium]